ncbi:F-box domain-containing protein [Heracleum sosnowskyi]|uniref:F-box domain-containing protein n=1 Tax=Heracleum sosnowskyi TaxID=360622 RepID=A0AAD8IA71_9APIA|nr:F-box domain-containing protein [Heracleum sosnowskyi]
MFDNLPENLFLEILSRLPVKHLLRLKVVCKSWRSRISNPNFVNNKHVAITATNPDNDSFIIHNLNNDQLYVINVNFLDRAITLEIPVPADNDSINIVGSCNGLLCVAHTCNRQKLPKKLYLWNPATRKVKHIHKYSIAINRKSKVYRVSLGFGFDRSSGDYKVVRIVTYMYPIEINHSTETFLYYMDENKYSFKHRVEVYSLNRNSWKEIGVEFKFMLVRSPCPVIVNGLLYWIVDQDRDTSFKHVLLSFNVESENFSTVSLPDDVSWQRVFEYKESVATPCTDKYIGHIDIWTLDDDNCWIKKLIIRSSVIRSSYDLDGCLKTGEFVGRIFSNEVVLYDSVNDVVKHTQLRMDKLRTYNFSESLVNLN